MDWISVKDRLPEAHLRVLVLAEDGYVEIGHHTEEGWWSEDGYQLEDGYEAARWQPLPEPPKEESHAG